MAKAVRQKLRQLLSGLTPSSAFGRSVAMLAGATGTAQLIGIGLMPILTRIYTPEEFGGLAVYSSVLGILVVVASLRYELAIPLPKSNRSGRLLVTLCAATVLFMTALVAMATGLFGERIAAMMETGSFEDYLWLLPVGFLFVGLYQVLMHWAVRNRSYKLIAQTKIIQAGGMAGTQLLFGLANFGIWGLIFGHIVGQAAGATHFARTLFNLKGVSDDQTSCPRLRVLARKYWRFPLYGSLSSLISAGSLNAPTLFVAMFISAEYAGLFFVAQRVLGIPLDLVGKSISQVFHGEASKLLRDHPAAMSSLFFSLSNKLALMAALPVILLFLFAETLFEVVLGENWTGAGAIAGILSIMLFFRFIFSPLSIVLLIIEKQGLTLLVQSVLFVGAFLSLMIPRQYLDFSAEQTMWSFSIAMALIYDFAHIISMISVSSFCRNRKHESLDL